MKSFESGVAVGWSQCRPELRGLRRVEVGVFGGGVLRRIESGVYAGLKLAFFCGRGGGALRQVESGVYAGLKLAFF